MIEGLAGLAAMLLLGFMRVPLAVSMGLVGFVGLMLIRSPNAAYATITNTIYDTGFAYTLIVIPLFILMGNFVTAAGMSRRLYQTANAFVGHRKGGLATATILSCAGFGAVCGSAVATSATMSRVAYPSMREFGYSDRLSAGSIAAGGTLGILIPPSNMMIIYCILTEQHIGKMFAAGILPGILAVCLYFLAIQYTIWRDPSAGPRGSVTSWPARFRQLRHTGGVLLLFGVVMGGLFGGFFTSTEAAAIGAMGGFVLAVASGVSASKIVDVLLSTTRTTAMLFAILMGALVFSNFLNFTSLPASLTEFVSSLNVAPILVVVVICAIYVVLGAAMEELSMILLTVPLFFPLVVGLGFDPIWFGILIVCVVEIGLISPPVGMNIFVINSMIPSISTPTIWRGVMPFFVADIFRLALLIAFPTISLFIPAWLYG